MQQKGAVWARRSRAKKWHKKKNIRVFCFFKAIFCCVALVFVSVKQDELVHIFSKTRGETETWLVATLYSSIAIALLVVELAFHLFTSDLLLL